MTRCENAGNDGEFERTGHAQERLQRGSRQVTDLAQGDDTSFLSILGATFKRRRLEARSPEKRARWALTERHRRDTVSWVFATWLPGMSLTNTPASTGSG